MIRLGQKVSGILLTSALFHDVIDFYSELGQFLSVSTEPFIVSESIVTCLKAIEKFFQNIKKYGIISIHFLLMLAHFLNNYSKRFFYLIAITYSNTIQSFFEYVICQMALNDAAWHIFREFNNKLLTSAKVHIWKLQLSNEGFTVPELKVINYSEKFGIPHLYSQTLHMLSIDLLNGFEVMLQSDIMTFFTLYLW